MGTKNKPGEFDCYAKAEPDEPMFTLLARDEDAPDVIAYWLHLKMSRRELHYKSAKAVEAVQCAVQMEVWREKNKGRM